MAAAKVTVHFMTSCRNEHSWSLTARTYLIRGHYFYKPDEIAPRPRFSLRLSLDSCGLPQGVWGLQESSFCDF